MPCPSDFNAPSIIPASAAPIASPPNRKLTNHYGEWYLLRTSNTFWQGKSNVRMHYTVTGEDRFTYRPANSSVDKAMQGTNTLVAGAHRIYTWQGKGLMRLFTAWWEILGFGKETTGEEWLVTFQHKTMFTSPAVNVACRDRDGPDEEVAEFLKEWLSGLGDEGLKKAAENMYAIDHDAATEA